MIHLDLNEEEKAILLEMLETCIGDLRVEIADTDNLDYKTMLKGRKAIFIKLFESLQAAEVSPVSAK
jgi:hypothetical protein